MDFIAINSECIPWTVVNRYIFYISIYASDTNIKCTKLIIFSNFRPTLIT